jgi:hypothetical protein
MVTKDTHLLVEHGRCLIDCLAFVYIMLRIILA